MRLKIQTLGDTAEGIVLKGNPANPEPIHTRIVFPGGDVDVSRTEAGDYWVHIRVNDPKATSYDPCKSSARIATGRVDHHDRTKHLDDEVADAYHFAVKVGDIQPARA